MELPVPRSLLLAIDIKVAASMLFTPVYLIDMAVPLSAALKDMTVPLSMLFTPLTFIDIPVPTSSFSGDLFIRFSSSNVLSYSSFD